MPFGKDYWKHVQGQAKKAVAKKKSKGVQFKAKKNISSRNKALSDVMKSMR